jgi:hypothetical protein
MFAQPQKAAKIKINSVEAGGEQRRYFVLYAPAVAFGVFQRAQHFFTQ